MGFILKITAIPYSPCPLVLYVAGGSDNFQAKI
jgi:hypothetical protein